MSDHIGGRFPRLGPERCIGSPASGSEGVRVARLQRPRLASVAGGPARCRAIVRPVGLSGEVKELIGDVNHTRPEWQAALARSWSVRFRDPSEWEGDPERLERSTAETPIVTFPAFSLPVTDHAPAGVGLGPQPADVEDPATLPTIAPRASQVLRLAICWCPGKSAGERLPETDGVSGTEGGIAPRPESVPSRRSSVAPGEPARPRRRQFRSPATMGWLLGPSFCGSLVRRRVLGWMRCCPGCAPVPSSGP